MKAQRKGDTNLKSNQQHMPRMSMTFTAKSILESALPLPWQASAKSCPCILQISNRILLEGYIWRGSINAFWFSQTLHSRNIPGIHFIEIIMAESRQKNIYLVHKILPPLPRGNDKWNIQVQKYRTVVLDCCLLHRFPAPSRRDRIVAVSCPSLRLQQRIFSSGRPSLNCRQQIISSTPLF